MSRSHLFDFFLAAALTLAVSTVGTVPAGAVTQVRGAAPARNEYTALTGPGPFTEPPFADACAWHVFGEGETPPWWLALSDPLCVEYSKRDITFDDGGALRFLVAEPARVAISLAPCRYYQKDHWSVQSTTGAVPWVAWDGQYWWDKTAGRAGARLTNFQIRGIPVGVEDVVDVLRPQFPELADVLAAYGASPGESGLTTSLPFDLRCAVAG